MSWRSAAALLVRLAPTAAEAAAARQGLPAVAAAMARHALPLSGLPQLARGFAASAVSQQAEATAAAAAAAVAARTAASAAVPAPAVPAMYTVAGRVTGEYGVQPKRVFAVVEVGGTQFKVTPDDVIVTERLRGVDVNDKLALPRVLLLGSEEQTVIGRPYVPEAYVTVAVEVGGRMGAPEVRAAAGAGGSGAAAWPRRMASPAAYPCCSAAQHPAGSQLLNIAAACPLPSLAQEQFLDGKVLIFHKRRRKNSRRLKGHRQVSCRVLQLSD